MQSQDMSLLQELLSLVSAISSIAEGLKLCKKECAQLVRRLKLIAPLLEEVADSNENLPEQGFSDLVTAMQNAKQLVALCQAGPKLYLVLEKDSLAKRFQEIATQLARALDQVSLDQLDVSDEAREQFDLVHSQLKRVKTSSSLQEARLRQDLLTVLSRSPEDVDRTVLHRLAESLQLGTQSELKRESQAIQNLDCEEETADKLLCVLRMLRVNPVSDSRAELSSIEMARLTVGSGDQASRPIPEDFRCPISLELMKDPVIVATGQTYERASIQKWLDAGHRTCPKTQQVLPHLVLTPNYVLRSLITQWCEKHGVDLPKRNGSTRARAAERAAVEALIQKLACGEPEMQKAAAGEIRLLVKRIAENRDSIADAGGIPLLVSLLASSDNRTQEHAVTALLNLSINDNLKRTIARQGAIDPVVDVLKFGSMEARENAAATLFSLSTMDENKVTIGASAGCIPALVNLLIDGTIRGKKDAATAIYNLSLLQENKARAVRAGAVPPLMNLMRDATMGMVGESLVTLALLAAHEEGRAAIGREAGAVHMLVEFIQNGSSKNKENAAGILHGLCMDDPSNLAVANELGILEPLTELALHGTARARRKACSLLEQLTIVQEQLHQQQQQQQQQQHQQQQQDQQQQQQDRQQQQQDRQQEFLQRQQEQPQEQ